MTLFQDYSSDKRIGRYRKKYRCLYSVNAYACTTDSYLNKVKSVYAV